MDRRIYGIENEYGVTCTLRGQRRLSPDEVARYLFRRVVSWGRSSNVFLENGSRLYLDVGSHPEYATPECDSLSDLIAHDKAGERILEGLVESAEERLTEEGIRGDIYLFKNNTDSAGNSYGCHENYLVGRQDDFQRTIDTLIPFFVSRQIFAGAGNVLHTARGTVYSISQRAEHIWEGSSSATTRSRPIINTRDEPHADAERYRRLHVIAGDSNMSEYVSYAKVGTTAALLQMLEDLLGDGFYTPVVCIDDEVGDLPVQWISNFEQCFERAATIAVFEERSFATPGRARYLLIDARVQVDDKATGAEVIAAFRIDDGAAAGREDDAIFSA